MCDCGTDELYICMCRLDIMFQLVCMLKHGAKIVCEHSSQGQQANECTIWCWFPRLAVFKRDTANLIGLDRIFPATLDWPPSN